MNKLDPLKFSNGDNQDERFGYLEYSKVKCPLGFFEEVDNGNRIFQEAVRSYIYGLPNASQPTSVRCLEIAIKEKYRREEDKAPKDNLKNLIDWAGEHLEESTEIQQGLRLLRNYIHENSIVKEVDALESIRHTAEFVNKLFPPPKGEIKYESKCAHCSNIFIRKLKLEERIIGAQKSEECPNCGNETTFVFTGKGWR